MRWKLVRTLVRGWFTGVDHVDRLGSVASSGVSKVVAVQSMDGESVIFIHRPGDARRLRDALDRTFPKE